MSRSARLLDLIQLLRVRQFPARGADLAQNLGVSLRTLYRDIATLQAQGAPIDGEAGLGYLLRPGFLLPPLMFTIDEIEALVLGARLVSQRGDPELVDAAQSAIARIRAVLPDRLRDELETTGLIVPPPRANRPDLANLRTIRQAIQRERKLEAAYTDRHGEATNRVIWPFVLGFLDQTEVVAAWCETRNDFRHFRLDRFQSVRLLPDNYPKRRYTLLAEWRDQEGIRSPPADRI